MSDAREGRGPGGRNPEARASTACQPRRCSSATKAGQLAAASWICSDGAPRGASSLLSGRPAARSRRRSPGTRTPERKEGAPAAAPHLPRSARPRRRLATRPQPPRPPEQRAHPELGQIQRSRARGRGPRRGSGVGERGGEGGEQQVLQLPSLPTARPRRARDAARGGKRAPSANEFTFFFPPRALPLLLPAGPLQPPPRPIGAGPEFFRFSARDPEDGGGEGGGNRGGKGEEASRAPSQGAASRTVTLCKGSSGPSVPETGVYTCPCVCV